MVRTARRHALIHCETSPYNVGRKKVSGQGRGDQFSPGHEDGRPGAAVAVLAHFLLVSLYKCTSVYVERTRNGKDSTKFSSTFYVNIIRNESTSCARACVRVYVCVYRDDMRRSCSLQRTRILLVFFYAHMSAKLMWVDGRHKYD